MSNAALTWARHQTVGNASAKAVLIELATLVSDKDGECSPTIDQLKEVTELNFKTIIAATKTLEERGLIMKRRTYPNGRPVLHYSLAFRPELVTTKNGNYYDEVVTTENGNKEGGLITKIGSQSDAVITKNGSQYAVATTENGNHVTTKNGNHSRLITENGSHKKEEVPLKNNEKSLVITKNGNKKESSSLSLYISNKDIDKKDKEEGGLEGEEISSKVSTEETSASSEEVAPWNLPSDDIGSFAESQKPSETNEKGVQIASEEVGNGSAPEATENAPKRKRKASWRPSEDALEKNLAELVKPEGVTDEEFRRWVEFKRKMTKSHHCSQDMVNQLERAAKNCPCSVSEAIRIMMENEWVGVKADWLRRYVETPNTNDKGYVDEWTRRNLGKKVNGQTVLLTQEQRKAENNWGFF